MKGPLFLRRAPLEGVRKVQPRASEAPPWVNVIKNPSPRARGEGRGEGRE